MDALTGKHDCRQGDQRLQGSREGPGNTCDAARFSTVWTSLGVHQSDAAPFVLLRCLDILSPCKQAPPVALRSVLEGEIRAFAAHQGVDGHRQCMRKFLELLLARGKHFRSKGVPQLLSAESTCRACMQ